ncbi:MAG TPA: efflux RND transporter periplasmic adaptor subunit [Opitutus sp.]|nr:efflux RND transporter periplasmic adaptor subunit [Opitutus sp.]
MKKRVILTTLVALAVVGAIFGYKILTLRKAAAAMAAMKPRPAAVTTAPAVQQNWRTLLSAVGSVESYQGITVRTEIEGRVLKIGFESGTHVNEGDLLIELESSTEQAQLTSAEAGAKLAQASLNRARELRSTNVSTAAELDVAEANHAQAIAAVDAIKATLAKKRIVAPFAGRVGIRTIDVGEFLNKGEAVVTLEAVDPAYVDFALPQQDIPQLRTGLTVRVSVDAFPDRTFEGKIEAIDPRVTETTRNVRVRAIVPNSDEILRPGLFARVAVELPAETPVLELPATAIVYSPYGNSVYVVVEKAGDNGATQLVVEQRFVTTGTKRGDLVSIVNGLKPGEQVVTSGQMKLRNGAAVVINNSVVPASNPAPTPAQS